MVFLTILAEIFDDLLFEDFIVLESSFFERLDWRVLPLFSSLKLMMLILGEVSCDFMRLIERQNYLTIIKTD